MPKASLTGDGAGILTGRSNFLELLQFLSDLDDCVDFLILPLDKCKFKTDLLYKHGDAEGVPNRMGGKPAYRINIVYDTFKITNTDSNFDMLYDIAKANDYQIISLSIQPYKVDMQNQYIYLLHNNLEESDKVNYEPVPIFGDFDKNTN